MVDRFGDYCEVIAMRLRFAWWRLLHAARSVRKRPPPSLPEGWP